MLHVFKKKNESLLRSRIHISKHLHTAVWHLCMKCETYWKNKAVFHEEGVTEEGDKEGGGVGWGGWGRRGTGGRLCQARSCGDHESLSWPCGGMAPDWVTLGCHKRDTAHWGVPLTSHKQPAVKPMTRSWHHGSISKTLLPYSPSKVGQEVNPCVNSGKAGVCDLDLIVWLGCESVLCQLPRML